MQDAARRGCLRDRQREGEPEQQAEDDKGQRQMRGEAEMADGGNIDKAAGDHIPAHHALRPAENEHAKKFDFVALRDHFFEPEEG